MRENDNTCCVKLCEIKTTLDWLCLTDKLPIVAMLSSKSHMIGVRLYLLTLLFYIGMLTKHCLLIIVYNWEKCERFLEAKDLDSKFSKVVRSEIKLSEKMIIEVVKTYVGCVRSDYFTLVLLNL